MVVLLGASAAPRGALASNAMTKKTKTARRRRVPLTITIRGAGVDVNATIEDPPEFGAGFKAAITSIAEQLAGRASTGAPAQAQKPDKEPSHDFDAVLRAIKHGDLQVVQAIANIVNSELEARSAAS